MTNLWQSLKNFVSTTIMFFAGLFVLVFFIIALIPALLLMMLATVINREASISDLAEKISQYRKDDS